MQYKVNADCIGCGLCANTCPEVFHMTDAGLAEANPDAVPAAAEAAAAEAMSSCPAGAIEKA